MNQAADTGVGHPLLWSEGRRRLEERRIAGQCLLAARRHAEERRMAKIHDQEEYRKMIETHNPWGKPGGGAPNPDIHRRNILSEGLYPETFDNPRTPISPPARLKYRGTETGGGGAPIRSPGGKIIAPLKEDPMLAFNEQNREHVDKTLRYKKDPTEQNKYRQELDKQAAEHTQRKVEENRALRGFEPKTPVISEYQDASLQPWGKPGPGGIPWRPPKNVGQNFMKSMGWTSKRVLKEIDKELSGPNGSPKDRKDQIKPLKLDSSAGGARKENQSYLLTNCCSRCVCECPARFEARAKTQQSSGTTAEPSSKPKPFVAAAKPTKRVPRKPPNYVPSRTYMITGGVELVPLLAKRRGYLRPISLSTTDVTKVRDIHTSCRDAAYLTELESQINRRYHEMETWQQRDAEISQRHFETWSSFWGRPGHGAPLPVKQKLNLNQLLYKDAYGTQYDCE